VLSFILIKLFYFYRRSLYCRCAFVSPIPFLIMIPAIRIGSRAAFFRFIGISRSADLSHPKPFSIIFGKRPAGATSDAGGDGEPPKRPRKLANPSDRVYVAPPPSLTIDREIPNLATISSCKRSARSGTSISLIVGIYRIILENLSIITNIVL
jgi:hypothetical protein